MKSFKQFLQESRMSYPEALALFGLKSAEASDKEFLKKKYRELATRHHPDRGGDLIMMQRVNAAYDILAKGTSSLGAVFRDPEWQKERELQVNATRAVVKKTFEEIIDIQKYVKHFESIFGEKFTAIPNFGERAGDATLQYRVEFSTQDRLKVLEFDLYINFNNMIGKLYTKRDQFDITVMSQVYIVINRKRVKLSQARYNFKQSLKAFSDPETIFPKSKLLQQIEKTQGKKLTKKDVIGTFSKELKASVSESGGQVYATVKFGEDLTIQFIRTTLMKIALWDAWSIRQGRKGEVAKIRLSIYEDQKQFDLFIDTLKRLQRESDPNKLQTELLKLNMELKKLR